MSIYEAVIELQRLFPEQSVNVAVELWSSVYRGNRQPELKPQWRIYVAEEKGGSAGQHSFVSEDATLETLVEMARQHCARAAAPKETIAGACKSIVGL